MGETMEEIKKYRNKIVIGGVLIAASCVVLGGLAAYKIDRTIAETRAMIPPEPVSVLDPKSFLQSSSRKWDVLISKSTPTPKAVIDYGLICNPDLQLEVDYLGSHYEGDTLAAKIFRGDMGVEVFLDDETELINGFGMVHFDLDDDKYNADDVLTAKITRYDSKGFASRHESGELVLEELCLGEEETATPIKYVCPTHAPCAPTPSYPACLPTATCPPCESPTPPPDETPTTPPEKTPTPTPEATTSPDKSGGNEPVDKFDDEGPPGGEQASEDNNRGSNYVTPDDSESDEDPTGTEPDRDEQR